MRAWYHSGQSFLARSMGVRPGGAHELDELGAVLAAADAGVSEQVVEAASPGFPVLAVVDERHGLVLVLDFRPGRPCR